jgi:hypothetical protein
MPRDVVVEVRVSLDTDSSAESAFGEIYLREIERGGAKRQVLVEGEGLPYLVVLDLDAEDRIIGIEVGPASRAWPRAFMEEVRRQYEAGEADGR